MVEVVDAEINESSCGLVELEKRSDLISKLKKIFLSILLILLIIPVAIIAVN